MSESGKERVGELGREGNENGEGEGLRMERERESVRSKWEVQGSDSGWERG